MLLNWQKKIENLFQSCAKSTAVEMINLESKLQTWVKSLRQEIDRKNQQINEHDNSQKELTLSSRKKY